MGVKVRCRKVNVGDGLGDLGRQNPIVVSIRAKWGGRREHIGHVVALLGDIVVDGNLDFAVRRCRESMNYICHNVLDGAVYDGINWARELVLKRESRK